MEYLSKAPSANRSMLVKDIVKGLHYLHSKNIVHADIHSVSLIRGANVSCPLLISEPQKNVLVSDDGHAILTDFGRAKILDELGFDTKSLAGCAAYMAPELFPTDDSVDVDVMFSKESDVYAYAMLCQKVRIQLILSLKTNLWDSRYSLGEIHSLGIRKKQRTITKSSPLSCGRKGHFAHVKYPRRYGLSWNVVGWLHQEIGPRLRESSSSWVSGNLYIFHHLLISFPWLSARC